MLNLPTAPAKIEPAFRPLLRDTTARVPEDYKAAAGEFPVRGTSAADLSGIASAMPWMKGAIDLIAADQTLRARLGVPGFSFRPIVLAGARADVRHELFAEMLARAGKTSWCARSVSAAARAGEPCIAVQAVLETKCINPIVLLPDVLSCSFGQVTQLARMLDRREAVAIHDPVLGADVDVSQLSWLVVVERATDLPGAFIDICHVVDVHETEADGDVFRALMANATINHAAADIGVAPDTLPRRKLEQYLVGLPAMSLTEMRKRAIDVLAATKDWENDPFVDTTSAHGQMTYVTVCQEISGVGVNGAEFVSTYERVTRPLPLAGSAVTPDIFRKHLLEEFPWLHKAINMIAQDMELVHTGATPRFQFRPLILHGPAGIGKSRFARRMADLAKVGYRYVSAGGLAGGAEFAGTGRSAEDPHPSTPVLAMYRSRTANPIVFVDEIDKIEHGKAGGTLEDALLAVLEPETAKRYFDECLQAQVDLSFVSYIFAVNDVHQVNPILLDRMRIVSVKRPPPEAFPTILENILREVVRDYAIPRHLLPSVDDFPEASLEFRSGKSIRNIRNIVFNRIPELVIARRNAAKAASSGTIEAQAIEDTAKLIESRPADAS